MTPALEETSPDYHTLLYQVEVLRIDPHCNWSYNFPFILETYKVWSAHTMPTLYLTSFLPMIGTGLLMLNASIELK